MYRAGLACVLAAAVVVGALSCSSSDPGPEPVQGASNLRTPAQEVTEPSCSRCLDIHLGDYNLFLLEDYSEGITVEGKVAAGGNITMSGLSVGKALPDDNVSNTLVAGGNLNITSGNVFGATWYGGSYTNDWSVNFHRGIAAKSTPIDFAARFTELRSLSSRLAPTPPNPNGTTEPKWDNLYMTGTDPCLNVFEVRASDFENAQGRNIEAPAGSFVVVNIRGPALTFSGGVTFSGGITEQRVLYNFVDATHITANGFGWPGTVLAPYAHLTFNNGGWSGGIYAVSLSGNAIGHLSPLEDMAGPQAEVCNGEDDDCNGQVDEGFECSGSGARSCTAWCGATGTQACNPSTCGYGECTSASCCHADADCSSPGTDPAHAGYCEGTRCVAKKGNGGSCNSNSQCSSAQCVDGVCCNTACSGACDACNLPGHEGTCSPAPSTVQCRASAGVCDAAEYCTGSSNTCPADGMMPAGTVCDDGNPRTTGSTCDGAGTCTGCGDGVKNGSEACDDGNTTTESSCPYGQSSCTTCNSNCTTVYHSLSAFGVGAGAGSIFSTPAGISCPAGNCTALFPKGTFVTLKAASAVGSTFAGWSGGGCGGTGDCVVEMTAATSVTANFSPPTRPVIVSTFQSATTAPPSGGVTFRVVASDPQSSHLSYSWTASIGTLGVPTSGATQSEVVWTPPPCVLTPTTASITATVTNAFNLTTTTGFTVSGMPICQGWATTGSMTSPRALHTATLLKNGKVLVVGGRSANSNAFLATAELYDPEAGTWHATGSMSSPREFHTATLLPDGRVLVTGGYDGSRRLATAEVYDPVAGTWSGAGTMSSVRINHTATLLNTGKVLVAGGYGSGSFSTATAELYDPVAGTWRATGAMLTPRREHTATLLNTGEVLVVGGWGDLDSGMLATAQRYNPALGRWTAAGSMPSPRFAHKMSLLQDGRVLVSGGYSNEYLATAVVYSGSWSTTGTMTQARATHSSTLLPNGKVLVAGGENGSTLLATARLYDPASGTWSVTGSMATGRSSHTETLLQNGKVLIAGGRALGGLYLETAELYTP